MFEATAFAFVDPAMAHFREHFERRQSLDDVVHLGAFSNANTPEAQNEHAQLN